IEAQKVTLSGGGTADTFTLTFKGQTTAALKRNSPASDVAAALEKLSTIGARNVAVTGDAGGPYTVHLFRLELGKDLPPETSLPLLTGTGTGGTTVTVVSQEPPPVDEQIDQKGTSEQKGAVHKLTSVNEPGRGLEFPIWTNKSSLFGVFMGKDALLATYDLPTLGL